MSEDFDLLWILRGNDMLEDIMPLNHDEKYREKGDFNLQGK